MKNEDKSFVKYIEHAWNILLVICAIVVIWISITVGTDHNRIKENSVGLDLLVVQNNNLSDSIEKTNALVSSRILNLEEEVEKHEQMLFVADGEIVLLNSKLRDLDLSIVNQTTIIYSGKVREGSTGLPTEKPYDENPETRQLLCFDWVNVTVGNGTMPMWSEVECP